MKAFRTLMTIAVALASAIIAAPQVLPGQESHALVDYSGVPIDLNSTNLETYKRSFSDEEIAALIKRFKYITTNIYGGRQHTGQLHHQRMWDAVEKALTWLCSEPEATHCKKGEARINEIEYNHRGNMKNTAHIKVKVKKSQFHKNWLVRKALIDQVAYTYRAMTEYDKNCYHKDLTEFGKKGWTKAYWCQVRKNVDVMFRYKHDFAMMDVELEFNGNTDKLLEGKPNCDNIKMLEKIGSYAGEKIAPTLKTALPESEWPELGDVFCTDKKKKYEHEEFDTQIGPALPERR